MTRKNQSLFSSTHHQSGRPAAAHISDSPKSIQRVSSSVLRLRLAPAALLCLFLWIGANAQTTSGVITGRVVDASGAVIPGAMIALINEATTAQRELLSSETGDFVFTSVLPGRYTVRVELQGMKRSEKTNINITASERLVIGDFQLEVGDLSESVTVEAQGTAVQTQTQERSALLTPTQMESLAAVSRDYLTLARVLPGVVQDPQTGFASDDIMGSTQGPKVSGLRADFNSYMVEGLAMNASSDKANMRYPTNMDAISEVKVLMNNYSAEYGRAGGAMFQVVTKSGGQAFHGGAYVYNRHEQFNANSFFNNRNGLAKPRYRYTTAGFTLGGPITWPGKVNSKRDKLFFFFSNETIRGQDPQPLVQVTVPTAAERAGDFSQSLDTNARLVVIRDPRTGAAFPGNIVPTNRIDLNGQKFLEVFPLPNQLDRNITRGTYNYVFQESVQMRKMNNTFRIDANLTNSLRAYFRVNLWNESNVGYRVGAGQPQPAWGLLKHDAGYWDKAYTLNLTYVITPRLVQEFQFAVHRPIQKAPAASQTDLERILKPNLGMTLPQFYPELNPLRVIPFATFGGVTGAANILLDGRFPKWQPEKEGVLNDSLSWNWTSHNFKFGLTGDMLHIGTAGSGNFSGRFDFGRDVNNPADSNYAYSNAILGNFTSYQEITYRALYKHVHQGAFEWYAQDNWKLNRKLTLDYGLRWSFIFPDFDTDTQSAFFDPARYDPRKAVSLYQPALNAQGQRVARNPLTGEFAIGPLIGAIVPNSGDITNGSVVQGNPNYPKFFVNRPPVKWGPRFGFAYDPFSTGKTAIRGGAGIMYNYDLGGAGSSSTEIPPRRFTPFIYYGSLSNFINAGTSLFPSATASADLNIAVPTVYNLSLGFQRDLGFGTVVDVAYVGTMGRHLGQIRNINLLPYGTRFKPENQDPTTGRPLSDDFLRPYPGYSTINQSENVGSSNYHSLQVQVNRRFSRGLQFGSAWTWSKSLDYASGPSGWPTYVERRTWSYGLSDFDRRHMLSTNWEWNVPRGSRLWNSSFMRTAFDDWKISGIVLLSSGAPQTIAVTTVDNADLTGGGDGTRPNRLGNPILPKSERTVERFFNPDVWGRPAVGEIGNAGRNTMTGAGINNWDLSFFKDFPVKEKVRFQFRWEMFNAFNHTQFYQLDTTARFDAAGRQTNGQFGALITARQPRRMQGSLRLTF